MRNRLIVLLSTIILTCANKTIIPDGIFICDNGKIHFLASTPLEDIEATSDKTVCAFNLQTQKVEARVEMKTFEFRRKKMQDDFNEDYIESDKFPYATLDAVVVNKLNFSKDGIYDIKLRGTLEVHGVKEAEEIMCKLTIKGGQPVRATAQFDVPLVDYHIKIPTIVVMKIAEVVKVDVGFDFRKK